MNKRKNPSDDEVRRFWTGLADSVEDVPDKDLLGELRETGEDTAKLAHSVREVLRDTAKRFRQRALHEAKQRRQDVVRSLSDQQFSLPADVAGKRALLAAVFARQPELTAQFRDL